MSPVDQARLSLMVEEYKTLRDEIGRFQNQQKQSLMAGVVAIALGLFSSTLEKGGANFVDRPFLILLLPLILAPIGIIYFETEISIFRAATYLGVDLRAVAEKLCDGSLQGVWNWEAYRAREKLDAKKIETYPWSKWILFLGPSPASLILFFAVCVLHPPTMNSFEFGGHVLLVASDSLLVFVLFRYYKKADRMWKALDNSL